MTCVGIFKGEFDVNFILKVKVWVFLEYIFVFFFMWYKYIKLYWDYFNRKYLDFGYFIYCLLGFVDFF